MQFAPSGVFMIWKKTEKSSLEACGEDLKEEMKIKEENEGKFGTRVISTRCKTRVG